MHFHDPQPTHSEEAPTPHTAHLFGGPLDGHHEPNLAETTSSLIFEGHAGSYHYCPHATAHFQRLTFIHSTIEHDLFHPSLTQ